MRLLVALFAALVLFAFGFSSCQTAPAPASFCDTSCLRDSIKFTKEDHPLKPYVYISADDCMADTIAWSYIDMGINRKLGIRDLVGTPVYINKDNTGCYIKDTSYAWLRFNDCSNGRGYLLKIPFNKKANIGRKSSAINSFDPKFDVADGLVAYSDRGNLFVEDMATGKTAMMTFGEKIDIDYDAIHEKIDSVNISPSRVWARVMVNNNWKTFEKNITLR